MKEQSELQSQEKHPGALGLQRWQNSTCFRTPQEKGKVLTRLRNGSPQNELLRAFIGQQCATVVNRFSFFVCLGGFLHCCMSQLGRQSKALNHNSGQILCESRRNNVKFRAFKFLVLGNVR